MKVAHHPLKIPLMHLAMGNRKTRLGHEFFECKTAGLNRLHLVMQHIGLAATFKLPKQRLAHDAILLCTNKGLDRKPSLRRGCNHREVANTFHAHGQCSGNGRGCQGEHINL